MRTFDLFNTLATSHTGVGTGEVPVEQHIPIAENIEKVEPEDVIVSDYHSPEKAAKILRRICGLTNNLLIVTEDGKATGRVWDWFVKKQIVAVRSPESFAEFLPKPESHLGDNPHSDVAMPAAHGIPGELTRLHEFTDVEKQFQPELAQVMREVRLATWNADPKIRGLQLHQIERNFPFLLKVAFLLERKMREGGFTTMLLCSRDCFLLSILMELLFRNDNIKYFLNSRVTRYRPSESYAAYAKEQIGDGKTLIVDMCGTGNSLKFFCDKFGATPLLVVSAWNNVEHLVHGGLRETSNPAPHDTIVDYPTTGSTPVKEEIQHVVNTFLECAKLAMFRKLQEPSYSLEWALRRMEDPRTECLWADHLADSKATYELLNSGPLPHEVIL